MTSAPALSVPTLLVLIPALGSLAARRAPRLATGFALVTAVLAAWGWFHVDAVTPAAELRSWIPSLGVSYIVGIDGFSAVLVGWVSLASLLSLVAARSDGRTASHVLFLEASVHGAFLARDVFLMVSFLGAALIAASLLANRKALSGFVAALTILTGWVVWVFRQGYQQTGFVSTDLARWQDLEFFPAEARALLAVAGFGVACMVPVLGVAMDEASVAGRLALAVVASTLPGYWMLRLAMPVASAGLSSTPSWALAFALLLMLYGVSGRSWGRLTVSYQALVVLGLFSFSNAGIVGATVLMLSASIGWFGAMLPATRVSAWWFALFLVGMPFVTIVSPLSRASTAWLVIAVVGIVMVAGRLRGRLAEETYEPLGMRVMLAAPAWLLSASMFLALHLWTAQIEPVVDWSHSSRYSPAAHRVAATP